MDTTSSHNLLVAEDDQHLAAPRPSCLLICVNILSCLLPPIIFLPDRQLWAKYLPAWRWIQFLTLSMWPRTWWLAHWLWLYWQKSCHVLNQPGCWQLPIWSEKNVAINQLFANYMSHKVKKALALVMIWVARHLGDEPVLAVGSLSRDKQRSISQLLLSKRQRSCSQQVGGPAESQHCLYLQKFLNSLQSISSAKTMTQKKVQILYSCWCRRKSPDKMTCWEVANWTELLYWGCLTLVSWLLKRSKKPRRRKNALEGGWERDKQDAGCWTFTCSAK